MLLEDPPGLTQLQPQQQGVSASPPSASVLELELLAQQLRLQQAQHMELLLATQLQEEEQLLMALSAGSLLQPGFATATTSSQALGGLPQMDASAATNTYSMVGSCGPELQLTAQMLPMLPQPQALLPTSGAMSAAGCALGVVDALDAAIDAQLQSLVAACNTLQLPVAGGYGGW